MVELSDVTKAKLQELGKKYSDLCDDTSALSEPTRSITEFLKCGSA